MKSVLISIKPKWCKLIASGEKTLEIRKTRPKIEMPFKCYIYCTNDNVAYNPKKQFWKKDSTGFEWLLNGKVIGEFICDKVTDMRDIGGEEFFETSCMTFEDWKNYTDYTNHIIWGWHISNLVIYDKPKEITEFYKPCTDKYEYCQQCKYGFIQYPSWVETSDDLNGCSFETTCLNIVKKPPQSWCYVKDIT